MRLVRPHLSLIECLIFGSTLSATDPVTILAIFNTYKVDPQLYSIIFGESMLNDAVSIVMFETLNQLRGSKLSFLSIFYGFGIFAVVFSFSMVLGVVFGLACSLLLKHTQLGAFPELESCVVMLVAYTSYFFSNTVEMSGIVSLLFCGITLKHYAYHNMSLKTQRTTKSSFQTLSSISENFIFIYLGLSLFTGEHLVYRPTLILFTIVAVVASRYCSVFSIAWVLNQIRGFRAEQRRQFSTGFPDNSSHYIPRHYQLMLFWAGLRGAVGFALSEGIRGSNAYPLQTSVLVAVVITVIVFGGTTAQMLEILRIDTGVEDQEDPSSDHDEEALSSDVWDSSNRTLPASGWYRDSSVEPGDMSTTPDANEVLPGPDTDTAPDASTSASRPGAHNSADGASSALTKAFVAGPGGLRSCTSDELDETGDMSATEPPLSARDVLDRANLIFRDGQWFQRIDERYLLPMFSNTVANRKHEQRKEQVQARRHFSREFAQAQAQAQPSPSVLAVPYEQASHEALEEGRVSPGKNKMH